MTISWLAGTSQTVTIREKLPAVTRSCGCDQTFLNSALLSAKYYDSDAFFVSSPSRSVGVRCSNATDAPTRDASQIFCNAKFLHLIHSSVVALLAHNNNNFVEHSREFFAAAHETSTFATIPVWSVPASACIGVCMLTGGLSAIPVGQGLHHQIVSQHHSSSVWCSRARDDGSRSSSSNSGKSGQIVEFAVALRGWRRTTCSQVICKFN